MENKDLNSTVESTTENGSISEEEILESEQKTEKPVKLDKKGRPVPTGCRRVVKEVKEWAIALVVAVVVVYVLKTYIFMPITVDGSSMANTLQDGERLAVTVFDVRFYNGVKKGDVVICHYPGRTSKDSILKLFTVDTDFVKRVVGVPGDTVSRVSGVTYINGEALDPQYTKRYWYRHTATYEKAEDGTITYYIDGKQQNLTDQQTYNYMFDYEYVLKDDEYFVVGDNRYNSHDSREWNGPDLPRNDVNNSSGMVGPITLDMIMGRVRSVFWPLSDMRTVETNAEYIDPADE